MPRRPAWPRASQRSGSQAGNQAGNQPPHRDPKRYWSGRVTRESNALDLEPGVFRLGSSRAIAVSLKQSALASQRRKSEPYRSAMSMLNFYMNRAGRNLPDERRRVLQQAKVELRRVFGRKAA